MWCLHHIGGVLTPSNSAGAKNRFIHVEISCEKRSQIHYPERGIDMKTIITRIALPILAGGALLSFASAGVSAAAVPAPQAAAISHAQAAQSYTRGFFVTNHSSWDMRLDAIENKGQDDGIPKVGTVLKPGESMRYEKVFWFMQHGATTLKFTLSKANPNGSIQIASFEAKLVVTGVGVAYTEIDPDFRDLGFVKLDAGRDPMSQVTLIDNAASSVTVDAATDPERAKALSALCGSYSCNFVSTRTEPAPALVTPVTGGINDSDITQSYKRTLSSTVTSKSTFELSQSATLKLSEAISASMGSKYSTELTTGVTAADEMSFPIQPRHTWKIFTTTEANRECGNLTIHIGNTTFEVKGISIDVPKPGAVPQFIQKQDPIAK
jgi:hypothetical protein